jgi:hypothetical protein
MGATAAVAMAYPAEVVTAAAVAAGKPWTGEATGTAEAMAATAADEAEATAAGASSAAATA